MPKCRQYIIIRCHSGLQWRHFVSFNNAISALLWKYGYYDGVSPLIPYVCWCQQALSTLRHFTREHCLHFLLPSIAARLTCLSAPSNQPFSLVAGATRNRWHIRRGGDTSRMLFCSFFEETTNSYLLIPNYLLSSQHLHVGTLILCMRIEAVGWG